MPTRWEQLGLQIDYPTAPAGWLIDPPVITSGEPDGIYPYDDQASAAELSRLIKANGGRFDIQNFTASDPDPFVKLAQSQWWKFSVAVSTDGRTARVTENSYLLYGGIAVAAIAVIALVAGGD